jgi:hypothetical protein
VGDVYANPTGCRFGLRPYEEELDPDVKEAEIGASYV